MSSWAGKTCPTLVAICNPERPATSEKAMVRCMEGDVDRNARVDVDDVIGVVTRWGSDDFWADVDQSGSVGIDDLVRVILAWQ